MSEYSLNVLLCKKFKIHEVNPSSLRARVVLGLHAALFAVCSAAAAAAGAAALSHADKNNISVFL